MDQTSSTEKLLDAQARSSDEGIEGISDDGNSIFFPPRKPSVFHQISKGVIIHLALLVVYTSIVFAFWPSSNSKDCHPRSTTVYSPAQSAVKYETRIFENSLETANPYKGEPREELDTAWNKLLDPSAIRVSKEDLDRINKTSIPIADGSGYMATLDVHHQLHCLRWVRQMLHPEYYNMTYSKEKNLGQHVDHCLDSIRQFVMCKADVVLLTYDWIPNFRHPWPNFEIKHECTNWDSINEWAVEHSFDGFDEKLIKHPNFQPELPTPFSYAVSGNPIP